jgi:hypothetical protein
LFRGPGGVEPFSRPTHLTFWTAYSKLVLVLLAHQEPEQAGSGEHTDETGLRELLARGAPTTPSSSRSGMSRARPTLPTPSPGTVARLSLAKRDLKNLLTEIDKCSKIGK